MRTQTPGVIAINHIMYQPVFSCRAGCENCYLAPSVNIQNTKVNEDILDLIFSDEPKVSCEQFTISLDTTTTAEMELLVPTLKRVWKLYEQPKEYYPRLCINVLNLATLERWALALKIQLAKFLQPLSVVSLSNMPVQGKKCDELSELCKETNTVLNFNKMIDPKMFNCNLDEKLFETGVRYAHQVYLVLKKPALGDKLDKDNLLAWFKARSLVPKNKLVEDACIQDGTKWARTGFKCGAGISKVHIWPNNKVTGCPYDSNDILTLEAEKKKEYELLDELTKVTQLAECNHSMNHCNIALVMQEIELTSSVKAVKENIENQI